MDAFLVAFKIPNFLRRLFAEGAFSQGFVPVISEYRHKRTHEETQELVAGVAGTLGAVLFVVTVIGVVAAPLLILAFAPGFKGTEGEVRSGRCDAPPDLSVRAVHLAHRPLQRRAQQLRPFRHSGGHAERDERRDDPLHGVARRRQ